MKEAYLPNVIDAISAISVPVGPQWSLLVAAEVAMVSDQSKGPIESGNRMNKEHTISDFHLDCGIALCNVFHAAHDFRHCDGVIWKRGR